MRAPARFPFYQNSEVWHLPFSDDMRVSSIISDNINKGSELTEKLERETDSLWNARRLHAEQRGRLAETKMTIPLAVFLCVLIIITVAPAMMQL